MLFPHPSGKAANVSVPASRKAVPHESEHLDHHYCCGDRHHRPDLDLQSQWNNDGSRDTTGIVFIGRTGCVEFQRPTAAALQFVRNGDLIFGAAGDGNFVVDGSDALFVSALIGEA